MLSEPELKQRLEEYQKFVDDILKADLIKSEELTAACKKEISEYEQLLKQLDDFLQKGKACSLFSVDIGCGVYCEAKVPDPSTLYIDIGLGFHLECTTEEARVLASMRLQLLEERLSAYSEQTKKLQEQLEFAETAMKHLTATITPWCTIGPSCEREYLGLYPVLHAQCRFCMHRAGATVANARIAIS